MNINYIISISFILIAFGGVRSPHKDTISVLPATLQKANSPNVSEVKLLGDSVRLEIEKNGNVYVRHYIDLKGGKNNGFDNSYTVTSIYSNILNDINLRCNYHVTLGDYWIYFDKQGIIRVCDSILKSNAKDSEKKYYKSIKLCIAQGARMNYFGWEVSVIQQFKHKIVNRKTGEIQKILLVESYTTEFSGGKNFYVVSQNDDTTALFHLNEYMR